MRFPFFYWDTKRVCFVLKLQNFKRVALYSTKKVCFELHFFGSSMGNLEKFKRELIIFFLQKSHMARHRQHSPLLSQFTLVSIVAAVSMLITLFTAGYFYSTENSSQVSVSGTPETADIQHLKVRFKDAGKKQVKDETEEGDKAFNFATVTVQSYSSNKNTPIYGHIHLAKTGGTSLNGMLANTFERICGNKGYSLTAFQANERYKAEIKKERELNLDSSNSRKWTGMDYNWFPSRSMDKIGFENCDYISHETNWEFWRKLREINSTKDTPLELHVPCRDPVSHLMSVCNFNSLHLTCNRNATEFISSIEKCFASGYLHDRFSMHLKGLRLTKVKCYDFKKQFTTYMDYIQKRLQKRRFVSKPYQHRASNAPRNISTECIWMHPDLMEIAKHHMTENFEHHRFCNTCIGSEDDLTRSTN